MGHKILSDNTWDKHMQFDFDLKIKRDDLPCIFMELVILSKKKFVQRPAF